MCSKTKPRPAYSRLAKGEIGRQGRDGRIPCPTFPKLHAPPPSPAPYSDPSLRGHGPLVKTKNPHQNQHCCGEPRVQKAVPPVTPERSVTAAGQCHRAVLCYCNENHRLSRLCRCSSEASILFRSSHGKSCL